MPFMIYMHLKAELWKIQSHGWKNIRRHQQIYNHSVDYWDQGKWKLSKNSKGLNNKSTRYVGKSPYTQH